MDNSSGYSHTNITKDYYPFGMVMPGRSFSAGTYRFGFNGKENDNEVKGAGNQQDYGMRIYDTRLGKFLSVDPITKDYPELTPYQFASNTPIQAVDLDGLEAWKINRPWNSTDLFAFGNFIISEAKAIYSKVDAKEVSMNTCFDCADLAVHMYIQYAAANGLPITFTSAQSGKILDSSDPNLITYNESDQQASVLEFEKMVRQQTNVKSLKNNDVKNVTRNEAVPGDFIAKEDVHIDIIRPLNEGEPQPYYPYIPTISGTLDYNNPMYGKLITSDRENVNPYSDAYDSAFFRFKELYSASKNIQKMEPIKLEQIPTGSSELELKK